MKWALTSNDNGLSFWVACCLPVHHTKRFHMAMDIVLVLFASSARNAHDCCAVFAHRAHRSRYRFDSTHFITSKQTVRITDGGTQTFCYKPRQFVVRCCCCWCWFFCFWAFTISIVPGDHFYCCCCYYNIVLFLKNVKKQKSSFEYNRKIWREAMRSKWLHVLSPCRPSSVMSCPKKKQPKIYYTDGDVTCNIFEWNISAEATGEYKWE